MTGTYLCWDFNFLVKPSSFFHCTTAFTIPFDDKLMPDQHHTLVYTKKIMHPQYCALEFILINLNLKKINSLYENAIE